MKNKSKITKGIAIGLFVAAFLLNISLTFDSGNSRIADLSLGSLKISLFQKAYAESGCVLDCGDGDIHQCDPPCSIDGTTMYCPHSTVTCN